MIKWMFPKKESERTYTYCSNPILVHGLIYTRDLEGTVRAFRDKGEYASFVLELPLGGVMRESFHKPFQMIADEDGIYVARVRYGHPVYSLIESYTHEGKMQWSVGHEAEIPQMELDRDCLVVAAGTELYAFSKNKGIALWQISINKQILSLSGNGNGSVYIGSADGYLYAFDLDRICIRWRFLTNLQARSKAVIHGNYLYFGKFFFYFR